MDKALRRRKIVTAIKQRKYRPLVSVDGQKVFPEAAFGLLCYSFEVLNEFNTLAYVRYLNTKDAPNNLFVGSEIKLYEGAILVATGKIIEKSDFKFMF